MCEIGLTCTDKHCKECRSRFSVVIAHKRSARSIADIIFFKSVGRHLTVVLVVAINLINTYHDQDYAGPVSLKKLGEFHM